MKLIQAAEVKVGDHVRWDATEPKFREVVSVRRGAANDVLLDVANGNLVDSVPPLNPHERIEVQ